MPYERDIDVLFFNMTKQNKKERKKKIEVHQLK